ncbi:TetR/AcrR family transcriptional regulator [Brevibacterium sp. R8603A2]|uniref:TetR/AcrR family transcriptional regulator n=1 Tax=Brevibacterium sp. R8603A2 TaxID=2929779 RepID=UPI001FFA2FB7|nr:TetR/AcrR family transcriptional regulator [Brevibacterium sp. R8603A2]MCK1802834.1 TetR/AcrR family transcriptional regulator [Brevibacterium sp. R8603A2]
MSTMDKGTGATTRQTAKARRRQAILDHAKRLFAASGFRAVSIEEIGAGAGISGPAVYRHFGSKEDILAELLVGISEYLHAGGEEIAAGGGGSADTGGPDDAGASDGGGASAGDGAVVRESDPAGVLRRLVDFHLAFALGEPELIRIQDRDLTSLPAEARSSLRRLQRQYVSLWVATLRRHAPGLSEDAATVTIHAVFGMVNSTPYVVRRIDTAVVAERLRAAALATLGVADVVAYRK